MNKNRTCAMLIKQTFYIRCRKICKKNILNAEYTELRSMIKLKDNLVFLMVFPLEKKKKQKSKWKIVNN